MVIGDIFPALDGEVGPHPAVPLTDIYNTTSATTTWPEGWKLEFVTVIPKNNHLKTMNDIRNISCTLFLSKAYESCLLGWLNKQVGLREKQFGRVQGSGTEHFLVNLWQNILEDLEDPRPAAVMTSINYSKAFNSLDWNLSLMSLKNWGALNEIIEIISSFLTDSEMMVRIGQTFSRPRFIKGGVPQGSLLGVLLFNLAVDNFERFSPDMEDYEVVGGNLNWNHNGRPSDDNTLDTPQVQLGGPVEHLHLLARQEKKIRVLKYVDDNILLEKFNCEFAYIDQDGIKQI